MRNPFPALLLCCSTVTAQAASYSYVDQKSPYKNPSVPLLTALDLPKLGTTFKLRVPLSGSACCPFTQLGWLATGIKPLNVGVPSLGGFLYVTPDVILPTPWGSPGAQTARTTMSIRIPNSSQLLGLRFRQQVLRTAYNRYWRITDLSRGGVGVIGK